MRLLVMLALAPCGCVAATSDIDGDAFGSSTITATGAEPVPTPQGSGGTDVGTDNDGGGFGESGSTGDALDDSGTTGDATAGTTGAVASETGDPSTGDASVGTTGGLPGGGMSTSGTTGAPGTSGGSGSSATAGSGACDPGVLANYGPCLSDADCQSAESPGSLCDNSAGSIVSCTFPAAAGCPALSETARAGSWAGSALGYCYALCNVTADCPYPQMSCYYGLCVWPAGSPAPLACEQGGTTG